MRFLWLIGGYLAMGLGVLGIWLPLLPTTVFFLMAAYCFSRSSERLHSWLMNHGTFGPPIHAWQQHGAIALKAKILAVLLMIFSLVAGYYSAMPQYAFILQIVILTCVACFILTRPRPPEAGEEI
jgi:uncharacterized membrane protein YbaN (DUF454 family)